MTPDDKRDFIRARATLADPTKILWSTHAVQRLVAHGVTRAQVEHALSDGEVIEDYPLGHRALPDCLVLGFDKTGTPIHAVVALDEERDRLLVVTVYRPDSRKWSNDWKTRR